MREAERNLSPLRDFERLYGHSIQQQVAKEIQERENLLKSALPDFANSYLNAIHSIYPAMEAELERTRSAVEIDLRRHEAATAYQLLGETVAVEQALKSHYATVAEILFLAEQRLLRVPWDSLGSIVPINPSEFMGVRDHFTILTERYQSLALSYGEQENRIASFPPIVSGGPPLEILTSTKVMDSLSRHTTKGEDEELIRQAESDYEYKIERDTNELLSFNPNLRAAWIGAKEALRSGNPDRGRHVTVSLREVVTHTLHTLAPDQDIQSWTNDPRHFHDGRPTREARVLFICRGINHGPFSKFMSADVRANIEFIELFQRGTHSLAASFSDDQLRALIVRTESLLRFLLLTSQTN
jgi:hypothetical protein